MALGQPHIDSHEAAKRSPSPRLALRKGEATQALGISDKSFDAYAAPTIRVVRMGRVRLYPVAELQRWLESDSHEPLPWEAW